MARPRICGLASLAVWLGSFGCTSDRDPQPEPVQQAPVQQESAVEAPVADEVPAERSPNPSPSYDAELGKRFELAASGLVQSPAEARERGPSWRAPECELEYEFRIEVGNDQAGDPTSMMVIEGSWTARAAAPGMILKNGELRFGQQSGSVRRAGEGQPAGSLAEIRLQTEGRAWTEVDGPTALWSAYGTWAGLTKFHPALPEAGAPGSSADWALQIHERGSGGRVEAERGSLEVPAGVEPPKPEVTELTARVTLERWIDLDGSSTAAVLRSWSEAEASEDMQVHEISQGQFVVLESGLLLHAELRERASFQIDGGGAQPVTFKVAVDGEARLVRGCGGPVLPRLSAE